MGQPTAPRAVLPQRTLQAPPAYAIAAMPPPHGWSALPRCPAERRRPCAWPRTSLTAHAGSPNPRESPRSQGLPRSPSPNHATGHRQKHRAHTRRSDFRDFACMRYALGAERGGDQGREMAALITRTALMIPSSRLPSLNDATAAATPRSAADSAPRPLSPSP